VGEPLALTGARGGGGGAARGRRDAGRRSGGHTLSTRGRRLALALGALALAPPVWGFLIEPALLRNEDYELAVPRWPAACDGLRVAVLADLHVGSPGNGPDKLERVVALTQRARPDLVLLAGDYVIHGVVGGRFAAPEEIAPALARLAAPLGVWAVLGNHDWWLDGPRVRAAFEAVGIRFLEDAAARVGEGGCAFWLVGVSDLWEGRHDVRGALAQVDDGAPVVLFTHNPDVFPEVPARVELTIAGHTHGGQVYLPGIGRPIVPSAYGERYAIGHVVEQGRHLFVSSGLGTSILPVRFLVPPEVSVLTLRAPGRRVARWPW
jgi:predicted MPP superfamily phosphohydrolase